MKRILKSRLNMGLKKGAVGALMGAALMGAGLAGCKSLAPTYTTPDGRVVTLTKAEQKALRTYEDSVTAAEALRAVMDSSFIAAADQLTLKRGRTVNVSSNLNYVSLNGTTAVLQVGSTFGIMGPNGIGGITLEGVAHDITVTADKKGNISFYMRVLGSGLSAEVILQMAKGSNHATVQVKGTFGSNRITMHCTVTPFEPYKMVQGRSL